MSNPRLVALQKHSPAIALLAAGALALGTGLWWSPIGDWILQSLGIHAPAITLETLLQAPGYESLTPLFKASQQPGLAGSRGRYRLAVALLEKQQGLAVLEVLRDLERSYPVLAPQIDLKRAQAYEQMGETTKATEIWQHITQKYANSPVSVEALYQLGRQDSRFWETAIAKFPAHPLTLNLASHRLKQRNSPTAMADMLLIARHGLYRDDYGTILAKLVGQYSKQLQPQDWDAIAFGYWEHQDYIRAAKAYAKASVNPRNLYRVGRGFQLGQANEDDKKKAIASYQALIARFPQADDSGLALRRLAQLVEPNQRLAYLDRAIQQFPKQAPAALLQKIEWAKSAHNSQLGNAAAQQLLSQYSTSDSAAEYRWHTAQDQAQAGSLKDALRWAQEIVNQNPESEVAPAALFWMGRWTESLNPKPKAGQMFYQAVVQRYPASYYAWRSASLLGWPVGDFKTLRHLHTCTSKDCGVTDVPRPVLTVGSEALRELYTIGQSQEAWDLWQVEFLNPVSPTVNEQYTDGLLRQSMGEYLDGIFMVTFLNQRDDPAERSQVQVLKHQKDYDYALYPLPYWDLIPQYAAAHQVNPWLIVGLMRQESRFQPKIHSSAGAVGLMQVMPETGDWINQKLQLKTFDLENPRDNVNLGTWYLGYTHDEYQENSMLAVASYNAGPGAVREWVKRFGLKDLDQFVETIPFDETRKYVKSVFENYWNYLRLYHPEFRHKSS